MKRKPRTEVTRKDEGIMTEGSTKEYTNEIREIFGKRPAKVSIEGEDGSQKNWGWNEFRERLNKIYGRRALKAMELAVQYTVEVTHEYFNACRASSPEEALKIALIMWEKKLHQKRESAMSPLFFLR